MIVSITAEADADIETIGDFIVQDDPARAIIFTSELRGKCLVLADFPQKYPLVDATRHTASASACMAATFYKTLIAKADARLAEHPETLKG